MSKIEEKKVVFVIAESNFHDQEFLIPKRILESAGIRVFIAGTTNILSIGQYGLRVKPEIILPNLNPINFNAIVLVGGTGSKELWNNKLLHRKLFDFNKSKKLICAICSAVGILAHAKLLVGIKTAAYASDKEIIKELGANIGSNDIEIDNRIITASGPEAAVEFANIIVQKLKRS